MFFVDKHQKGSHSLEQFVLNKIVTEELLMEEKVWILKLIH